MVHEHAFVPVEAPLYRCTGCGAYGRRNWSNAKIRVVPGWQLDLGPRLSDALPGEVAVARVARDYQGE